MIKRILHSSWLALVLLFIYLPVLMLAVYSFTDTATIGTKGNFSLQNYVTLFTTPELRGMIGGTFLLAFGSALVATADSVRKPDSGYQCRCCDRFLIMRSDDRCIGDG